MTTARAQEPEETPSSPTSNDAAGSHDARRVAAAPHAQAEKTSEKLRPRDRWIRGLLPLFVGTLVRAPKFLVGPTARLTSFLHRQSGGRDMRILSENLERILGLAPGSQEHRRMTLAVTRHQAVSALETVRAILRPGSVRFDGLEKLREVIAVAEAAGKGHLIVTGHLGSWELVGHTAAKSSEKVFYAIAKPSRIAGITVFLNDLREKMGTPVLWTGRKSLLRDMLRALRAGESLGFVMDQRPEVGAGRNVDFFNRPTPFVVGPGALAARTGCAVIAVFCIRRGPSHFEVSCEELFPADHGEKDEELLTQRMAGAIEAAVRLAPEQWAWTYRRWRFDE